MKRGTNEKMMASVLAALVASMAASGCSTPALAGLTQAHAQVAYADEERLVDIAKDLGWPSEQISTMERDGVSARDSNVLSHAAQMLDHLEEKYNTPFTVLELESPSFGTKLWRMRAKPQGDAFAGIVVASRWLGNDAPPTDDLVSQVRADELEELVWGVLQDVYGGTGAKAVCDVTVANVQLGDDVGLNMSVEELSHHVAPSAWVYIAHDTKLDEKAYRECATNLSCALATRKIQAGFFLRRLLRGPSGDVITLDEAQSIVRDGKRGEDWDMAIVGTSQGWEE